MALEALKQDWDWRAERERIVSHAKLIWEQQQPGVRQFRAMHRISQMCEQLKVLDPEFFAGTNWFVLALEHAPIVLHLMQESEQVELNPLHHFLSAQELIARSKITGKGWRDVQDQVDAQVSAHLRANVPRPGLYAGIGYHRLKSMSTWDNNRCSIAGESA